MKKEDFLNIKYISQAEVEVTGANIADVKIELISKISQLREQVGSPFYFQKNGITTGDHKSPEHPNGEAGDGWFGGNWDWKRIKETYVKAVRLGFNGIGIYHNSIMYSWHLDIGKDIRDWTAKKKIGDNNWIYGKLLLDPKA